MFSWILYIAGIKLTSNTNDNQRLSGKQRKYDSPEDRRKQDLIDAIALIRFLKHIQREGQGRQDTAATVSTGIKSRAR